MTPVRAARLAAGFKTARDAVAAYNKTRRGDNTISLRYYQGIEAEGPRGLPGVLAVRLARVFACSENDLRTWPVGTAPARCRN